MYDLRIPHHDFITSLSAITHEGKFKIHQQIYKTKHFNPQEIMSAVSATK